MKLVKAWGHSSVIWLSGALGTTLRESKSAAEPSTTLSDQAPSTPAVTPGPTKEFAELNQQLQILVNDLAALRRNVEQLSGRQEQMSRDISAVQATEQNVSEKISSLTQADCSRPAAKKRATVCPRRNTKATSCSISPVAALGRRSGIAHRATASSSSAAAYAS